MCYPKRIQDGSNVVRFDLVRLDEIQPTSRSQVDTLREDVEGRGTLLVILEHFGLLDAANLLHHRRQE